MRYNYLVNALISNQQPVLLVGMVGTGKTSIAQGVLQSLDTMKWAVLVINMSAQVTCPPFSGTLDPTGRREGPRWARVHKVLHLTTIY